ncbi:single-stranded-DNA-specific exonuclease RecJ [Bacillus mojavensis]
MQWRQRKQKARVNSNESLTDRILRARGIADPDRFLNPTKDDLHDPYLMKNIERASNRIKEAIENNERVCLSYDADADGLTATTIMIRYLKHYTDNVTYIYSERSEGHGIENQISQFEESNKEDNIDLLIIVDSSSNDSSTCEKIKNMSTDIIILDHHAIENDNPHVVLVNPQQEDCEYPNKGLSGAGVVYKVIHVLEDKLKGGVDVEQYIDLVAVGMSADVMPVDILENRYLIYQGLRNVKNTGLIRILKGAKADLYRLNSDSIGFKIAPIINGVARLDNIKLAIDILLEDDDAVCKKLRLKMQKLNEKRKEMQREITKRYVEQVDDNKKVIFVADEESSKGFNGLVAQQLADKYKRPVIVGRISGGEFSGSFRSYNKFKFKKFLSEFEGEIQALGHEGAGGIIIDDDDIPLLLEYIERFMPEIGETKPTIVYDVELSVEEAKECAYEMERINHIVGNGFPKVIAKVTNITVENADVIGETRETVKIKTMDGVDLIKFMVDENYAAELDIFDNINVVGQLQMNVWFNFAKKERITTPQIMLEDYEVIE